MRFLFRKRLTPITLVLLTLPACIKTSSTKQAQTTFPTVRWISSTLPDVRDWTECKSPACFRHASLVMEGLVRIELDAKGTRAVNALASEIKRISDREFRIELRKGTFWSDGSELQARDFSDSWKRVLSHCKSTRNARLLFPIQNAERFCRGKSTERKVGIEVTSPTSFTVRLNRPFPAFVKTLAHPIFWPHRAEGLKEVTLGAFAYHGAGLYRRNPSYYGTPAKVDSLQFVALPSLPERIGLFRENGGEVVEDLPESAAVRLYGDPELVYAGTGSLIYLVLNPQFKPFQTPGTRKSVVQSISSDEVLKLLKMPLLKLTSLKGDAFLMEPLRLTVSWDKPDLAPIALNLQAQWAKNLKAEFELLPPERRATASLRLLSWTAGEGDPPLFLSQPAVHENWAIPLFEKGRPILKSPRLKPLQVLPEGDWSFATVEWS